LSAGGAVALDLALEVAPGGACLVHVCEMPGLAYRAADEGAALAVAPARLAEYLAWLRERGAVDLVPAVAAAGAAGPGGWRFRLVEHVAGAPVWLSGNPAALFAVDRRTLDDAAVAAYLRVARLALEEVRERVAPLSPAQLSWHPGPGRRSLAETLTHLGNVVWWYAARLDDGWPEPAEPDGEREADRPLRLLELASAFLHGVQPARRSEVHVPRRYPTSDPDEPWTHAKACRREAEHALEHLPGAWRDASVAARYAGAADASSRSAAASPER